MGFRVLVFIIYMVWGFGLGRRVLDLRFRVREALRFMGQE